MTPTTASIKVRATTALTAKVSPEDATDKAVSYESSKISVATVNSSGVVTGVSEGSGYHYRNNTRWQQNRKYCGNRNCCLKIKLSPQK
nr:Ig-like domain-containing protein [Lacticaseibacillus paracasei]